MSTGVETIHLRRCEERTEAVEALVGLAGGRCGLRGVLGDLDRRGRASRCPRILGRAVARALVWDAADRRDPRWWPQGVTLNQDGTLLVSWYSKTIAGLNQGVRVSVFDPATARYRHVLMVLPEVEDGRPTLTPLRVHAGGLARCGDELHIAATARGFFTARLGDIVAIPDPAPAGITTYGYRYLLPVSSTHRAGAADGVERMRYSFLDRFEDPPSLLAGEYGRGAQSTRLARFRLDQDLRLTTGSDGLSRPELLVDVGVRGMQGVAAVDGVLHMTSSCGTHTPGSVYVGTPGGLRRHRWATPIGPEDLTYSLADDLFWSVTEHPRRRWVYAMRRSWFVR